MSDPGVVVWQARDRCSVALWEIGNLSLLVDMTRVRYVYKGLTAFIDYH
jgi:hypothetical protein